VILVLIYDISYIVDFKSGIHGWKHRPIGWVAEYVFFVERALRGREIQKRITEKHFVVLIGCTWLEKSNGMYFAILCAIGITFVFCTAAFRCGWRGVEWLCCFMSASCFVK